MMNDSRNLPEQYREQDGIVYYQRQDVEFGGVTYQRMAIQTHFVERGESYIDLCKRYIAPLTQPGDMLALSEKIVSMCQDNVVERKDVKPGFWAKLTYRFAYSSEFGQGIHEVYKVQLAINIAGLPRFLWACFCSLFGKIFRRRGLFYKVIGHGIAGMDGFYEDSLFEPYRNMAILNPREPDKVCAEIEEHIGIPAMLLDANYRSVELFGKSPGMTLPDDILLDIMRDNPAGQNDEMTPLILIRPVTEKDTEPVEVTE
jgi:hypothetical protein